MKLIEIYFWNAVYWALYLPLSLIIYAVTEQGDILGILAVGAILTAILTVYLAFSDGVLFDDNEPAVIVYVDDEISEPVPVPKEETKPEVKQDEKQELDLEPEPKMRTDVELDKPDSADDDILG